jgi:hypothetical protein
MEPEGANRSESQGRRSALEVAGRGHRKSIWSPDEWTEGESETIPKHPRSQDIALLMGGPTRLNLDLGGSTPCSGRRRRLLHRWRYIVKLMTTPTIWWVTMMEVSQGLQPIQVCGEAD